MQLHNLQPKTKRKKPTRVGRGGTRGKTSGKGHKGQKARAGHKLRPEMRDTIKRLPKLRGRGKNSNKSIQENAMPINVSVLEASLENGAIVSRETLLERGIISRSSGAFPRVKILGDGVLTKKITIAGGIAVSKGAREKIESAGGTVTLPDTITG